MTGPNRDDQPHHQSELLLPWYATGQLEDSDRLLVERHLSSCSDCREQLIVERRIIHEFRGLEPEVEAGWARLRRSLQPAANLGANNRRSRAVRLNVLRHPAVATLAVAQLAVLVIGVGWLLTLTRPDYHALASAAAPSSADLIVIFRPIATEQDVRATLRSANASIVDGPTDADAYLLHVPDRQRPQALAKLQADTDVEMAQPIDEPTR